MNFNVLKCEKFIDMVSDSTLQLPFKFLNFGVVSKKQNLPEKEAKQN